MDRTGQERPQKRRRLNYLKCVHCRKDKKRCSPSDRIWPGQKCDRCADLELECSASQRAADPQPISRDDRSSAGHAQIEPIVIEDTDGSDSIQENWRTVEILSLKASWIHRVRHSLSHLRQFEKRLDLCRLQDPNQRTVSSSYFLLLGERSESEFCLVMQAVDNLLGSTSAGVPWAAMNILARLKTSPWHMEVPTSEAMVVDLASDSFCGKRQNQIGCCELEMSMIEGRLVYLLGSPPEKSLDTVSRYHKCSLEYTARLKQIYDRRNPALAPSSSKLPLIGGAPLARSALLSLDLPSSDIFGRNRLHVALYYEAFDEYPKSVISLEMARHKDRLGLTPLHIASIQGHSQCVKLLLELDVEHNARDDCLLTPLHYAAGFGHEEVVSLLLERYRFRNDEESIYATDQNRKTPLDLATAGEHDKVVEMLRKPASDVASGTSTGWSSHLEAPQDFTLGMKTPPIGVPVPSNPLPPLSRYFQTFDDPGTLATVETNDDSEGVWYLQCIVDGCHMKNKPWSDGEGFLRHLNGAHNWTSNFLEPEDLKQYLVRWHRVPLP